MLVPAGFTNTTRRPALPALAVRMVANCAQPASRIALLSPAFARGHVRQEGPGIARVGLGCRPAGHPGDVEFFQGDHVAGVHEGAGGLVVEVAAPVADLAPLLGQVRGGAAYGSPSRGARVPCAAAGHAIVSAEAARNLGLAMICPSEVVRNRATPTSTPAARPVAGSGSAPVSVMTMTYQRRCSRLSCSELDRPGDGPVLADLDRANGLERRPRPPAGRRGGPLRAVAGDEPGLAEPAVGLKPRIARFPLSSPAHKRRRTRC